MFIGLDHSKGNIVFNLIFSGIVLIYGLLTIGFHYDKLHSNGCGYLPMMILTVNTAIILIYFLINIYLLMQHRFDPRIRKKIKKSINVIRWSSLIWHIVLFSICLHHSFAFNNSCQETNNLIGFYLSAITVTIGLELALLITVLLLMLILIIFLIILNCCGYDISLEAIGGGDASASDPGTAYFSRTTVDTFKNLFSLGLLPNNQEEEDLNCPICLEKYTEEDVLRKMPCDHFFHQGCIDEWLKNNSLCPICKQNIRDGESKFNEGEIV